MDTTLIDKLYKIYKSHGVYNGNSKEMAIKSAYHLPESKGGGETLISNLNECINSLSRNVSNSYLSKISDKEKNTQLRDISLGFYELAYIAELFIDKINHSDDPSYDPVLEREAISFDDYNIDDLLDIKPQDLFTFNLYTLDDAYKSYKHKISSITPEIYQKLKDLIVFVKSRRSLQRIYPQTDIYNLNIEDILHDLKDYHKNNPEIFDIDIEFDTIKLEEHYNSYGLNYFDMVKLNCNEISSIDFKNYRPSMISSRGVTADIDKLVFMRNLLEFYKRDLFVFPDGLLYCDIDAYEEENIVDNFKKFYSSKFNNDEFIDKQSNPIFDVNFSVKNPEEVRAIKKVINGKSLAIGTLLQSDDAFGKQFELLHIFIKDITNPNSTYEIQLNALPNGEIEKRVQLVRFDNWSERQAHKNIGNKLNTTSHIHIYNHLDLLRGKKNGAYDIAYNLEDENVNFELALKTFINMIFEDKNAIKDNLYKKLIGIKTKAEEKISQEDADERK